MQFNRSYNIYEFLIASPEGECMFHGVFLCELENFSLHFHGDCCGRANVECNQYKDGGNMCHAMETTIQSEELQNRLAV